MISLLIPSRKRPHNIKRFCENVFSTKKLYEIEICFYIDDDDIESQKTINEFNNENIKYIIGPRILLSDTPNKLYEISKGPYYMLGGDDIMFRTSGWDEIVINEFDKYDDKLILVYGRDGVNDGGTATHFFIHKNWIDIIGRVSPPYFAVDRTDAWMTEVSVGINRKVYLNNLFIEHMHPAVGKAIMDETYKEANSKRKTNERFEIYDKFKYERIEEINKLKCKLNPK